VVTDHLVCFTPKTGEGVFLPTGTLHSLCGDVVVVEVQENSDVNIRFYDWGRFDAKTGQRRVLQVNQSMACIDSTQGVVGRVAPALEATTV